MAKVKKNKKTNAMRILENNDIDYDDYTYKVEEGHTDGMTVASTLGQDPDRVFKTLVTVGASKEHYVFVVPVNRQLSLKKAGKASGEKKIEMLAMKDLLAKTGYIHGGCSPIGMKKQFATFFHESVVQASTIICSGGKRGLQVEVEVDKILELTSGSVVDLVL